MSKEAKSWSHKGVSCWNRVGYGFGHNSHVTWCRVCLKFVRYSWVTRHVQLDVAHHLDVNMSLIFYYFFKKNNKIKRLWKRMNHLNSHAQNKPPSSPSHFLLCKRIKHHRQTFDVTCKPPCLDHSRPQSPRAKHKVAPLFLFFTFYFSVAPLFLSFLHFIFLLLPGFFFICFIFPVL